MLLLSLTVLAGACMLHSLLAGEHKKVDGGAPVQEGGVSHQVQAGDELHEVRSVQGGQHAACVLRDDWADQEGTSSEIDLSANDYNGCS